MPTKIAILTSALLLALNLSANARTALVIGNGAYTKLSALANPGNDARDMASSLTELGFEVQLLVDASHESIEDAVLDFGEKLHKGGGVGLFYYAGHGVQDQGRNYLIPVEANIRRATQLKRKAVDVGWVLDEMAAANNGLNMVILDACRDNPFAEFRSADRGLAKMEGPKGTFIAYATAPGDVAADGEGRNGLFTKHLLSAMQQLDQPVELAFKDVVKAVSDESRGRQTPFITSSLTGDFYFNPAGANQIPDAEQLITLTLRSNVYDDQVYINGAYAGQTKLVTQLAAGWHDIEVRKSGYRTYSARLLLDKDQTIRARLQRGTDPAPQPATTQAAVPAPVPQPAPPAKTTPSTIDGLSLDDWLLVYGDNTITTANLDKIIAYEQQHGGNAASRSYINKGLQVALADVHSADDLLEYQSKFGYLPGAPAQIEERLTELLEAGASRQDLIRLRAQFPASETLRLQLAGEYHRAQLFDAAAGEYQSWLGLTDSSHPQRKQVLEDMLAAREGRRLFNQVSATAVSQSQLIKLIGSTHSEYTKLDAYGYELPSSAKSWACVLDNRSGLIWEVKTDDGGARDKDNKYRWGGKGVSSKALQWVKNSPGNKYPESRRNGKGDIYNDWNKLVDAANSDQLCGFSDWRVPDLYQLASLVRCRGGNYKNLDKGCSGSYQKPTIDTEYFPNTHSSSYWSASPDANYSDGAWLLSFGYGGDGGSGRDYTLRVRLVRSGQ